ncbi:2-succinyl-5-enolpyruvyl-6-hydroxy-3-cyclohexene-1-carboxylate synthase [Lysinibacter cavernae]|uniref:2-succinyl-5-enolpyruvyl-6-hydroxy-3-cyclohexene-1-carboxylate synthase n=1 Tax=Lysinibacter cavernae TaxID=1640652 RepID=A0A7X5R1V7_9MICO|nr:thiamine pyrophosphate-binding protein [Lysinibacter cavernae]NIH54076.1 2-succinyl-5-enolpyruvyl-6-hydroxy-3-cyclohexene-1-carboxylate synthase [Lysinibacter cavernae]
MTSAPASDFAAALLATLIHEGVRDVVVCPGSRSQAIALAAAAFEAENALSVHVRVDERSAGFFALGLARELGRPVAVVTTSGTAVANLHPAVLEAHHSLVPLIVITADRPDQMRGIRSNQTTHQAHLFGEANRWSIDHPAPVGAADEAKQARQIAIRAVAESLGVVTRNPGPVQLNLAFVEPLSGSIPDAAAALAAAAEGLKADAAAAELLGDVELELSDAVATDDFDEVSADLGIEHDPHLGDGFAHVDSVMLSAVGWPDPRIDAYVHDDSRVSVVVAGTGAGAEAESFARSAGLPLLAEVSSGARFGRETIVHYRELLREPEVLEQIERVIVFGHPTLSREIPQLIARPGVETIVIAPIGNELYNPGHQATVFARAAVVAEGYDKSVGRSWLGLWVVNDRALIAETTTVHEPNLDAARETGYKERSEYAKAQVAVLREPVSRELLTESVWRATWPHDRLVVGASRLVRVLDGIAPGRNIRVISNRGLAGIDGTVATALGVADGSQRGEQPGATRVILGDLTLLHDVGSLLLTEGEAVPRLQLFVGNDNGGTIFDGLEVAATAPPSLFDRVMLTPHAVSIESLATAYGWSYTRVTNRGELEKLLTVPVTGPSLVEVSLPR